MRAQDARRERRRREEAQGEATRVDYKINGIFY